MKRLFVVGNSHTAALRSAWRRMEHQHPDVEIGFFATSVGTFHAVEQCDDGVIRLSKQAELSKRRIMGVLRLNGQLNHDIRRYDACVTVGGQLGDRVFLHVLTRYSIDGWSELEGAERLSRPALMAFARAAAESALDKQKVFGLPGQRRFLVSAPRFANSCLQDPDTRYDDWRTLAGLPEGGAALLETFREHLRAACAAREITLVQHPPETLNQIGLTLQDYSVYRPVLHRTGLVEADHGHLNHHYGALIVSSLLDMLRQG